MEAKLKELKARLSEINDLQSAAGVLAWDQNTYMPPGGAPARGRQIATLQRLAHEKSTDVALGRLLDDLLPYERTLLSSVFGRRTHVRVLPSVVGGSAIKRLCTGTALPGKDAGLEPATRQLFSQLRAYRRPPD